MQTKPFDMRKIDWAKESPFSKLLFKSADKTSRGKKELAPPISEITENSS